jgi:hypothetical protein
LHRSLDIALPYLTAALAISTAGVQRAADDLLLRELPRHTHGSGGAVAW